MEIILHCAALNAQRVLSGAMEGKIEKWALSRAHVRLRRVGGKPSQLSHMNFFSRSTVKKIELKEQAMSSVMWMFVFYYNNPKSIVIV